MLAGELYLAAGKEPAVDARRAADWMDGDNTLIARTQRRAVEARDVRVAATVPGSPAREKRA